jgi:uncharacterized membrane protein
VLASELHPFVVHFAVGLLLTAPICDVIGLLLRREPLLLAGKWMTIIGAIAAVLSMFTGIWAHDSLGAHSAAGEALLHLHQALGFVVAALSGPLALWRIFVKPALPLRLRTVYLAFMFANGVAVTVEATLGTTIVYAHGLGLSPSARSEPRVPAAAPATVKP